MPPFGIKRPVDTITRPVSHPEAAFHMAQSAEADPETQSLRDGQHGNPEQCGDGGH